MTRSSLLKLIFGVGAVFSFLFDGSLDYLFSLGFGSRYALVPYLPLLWLILSSLFIVDCPVSRLEVWAAGIGFCFDWYYTGIWGFFVFVFPLAVYLARELFQIWSVDFWGTLAVYGVDLTVVVVLGYFANCFIDRLTQVSSVPVTSFLVEVWLPTVFVNLLLCGCLYFPVRLLFNRCQSTK